MGKDETSIDENCERMQYQQRVKQMAIENHLYLCILLIAEKEWSAQHCISKMLLKIISLF